MSRFRPIKVGVGLQTNIRRAERFPSEAGYVEGVVSQMKAVTDNLIKVVEQIKNATPEIMYEALVPTLELALEYCPIDTGLLRSSAYLEITEFRGHPRVEMGFARGGQPEYAVSVHENLEWKHEFPTRAKFLEHAMNEDMDNIRSRLEESYKEMAGGSSGG